MANLKIVSLSPVALTLSLYVIVISIYAFYFHEQEIVAESGKWGEFGDFLGGLLNPLIGLITIWLFTKSLHQNSEMLAAAREELRLAREEIARGVEVQAQTKIALNSQIDIANAEKLFNEVVALAALWQELAVKYEKLSEQSYVGNNGFSSVHPNKTKWLELSSKYEKKADDLLKYLEKRHDKLMSDEIRGLIG